METVFFPRKFCMKAFAMRQLHSMYRAGFEARNLIRSRCSQGEGSSVWREDDSGQNGWEMLQEFK